MAKSSKKPISYRVNPLKTECRVYDGSYFPYQIWKEFMADELGITEATRRGGGIGQGATFILELPRKYQGNVCEDIIETRR